MSMEGTAGASTCGANRERNGRDEGRREGRPRPAPPATVGGIYVLILNITGSPGRVYQGGDRI